MSEEAKNTNDEAQVPETPEAAPATGAEPVAGEPEQGAEPAAEENQAGEEAQPTAQAEAGEEAQKADEAPEAEQAAGPKSEEGAPAAAESAEINWKALYAVTLADFDNYKKRAARDREDVYRYAEGDILKDVLPTVDNLALALEKVPNADDPFVKGVKLVYDGLVKALADHGAKPMEDLLGKELDPNFHEALATLPNAEIEEGKITNVVKNGWTLGGKLLRAAQVVVSAGKPQ